MQRYLTSLVLATLVAYCLPLHAKVIYVNNTTGHDRNLGQSADTVDGLAGPVRTINRAIELSGQGDFIILAPTNEPYRETICLFGKKQSGDDFYAFTIEGNGAILDGREMLPLEAWSHAFGNTFRFRPSRFTHFQLFEADRPMKRVAVEPGAKTPPPMNEMEWCICNGFVYVCLGEYKRPDHYRFTCSDKMTGVTIMQTANIRINDLIVQGYQVDGISIVNNTKNVILDNVIVRGNGRNGLTVGASSTVSVGFSLFGDNNAAQVDMAERSELLLYLCELKGIDGWDTMPKSLQSLQPAKIINNGGTLRQIGPSGVAASETSQKPDIANLWGKLVLASMTNPPPTTPPPSTLTVTETPIEQEPFVPDSTLLQSGDDNKEAEPNPPGRSNDVSPFDFDLGNNPFSGF